MYKMNEDDCDYESLQYSFNLLEEQVGGLGKIEADEVHLAMKELKIVSSTHEYSMWFNKRFDLYMLKHLAEELASKIKCLRTKMKEMETKFIILDTKNSINIYKDPTSGVFIIGDPDIVEFESYPTLLEACKAWELIQ